MLCGFLCMAVAGLAMSQQPCQTLLQTRYVEHDNRICVSKRAIPTCPRSCIEAESDALTVPAYCGPATDSRIKYYIAEANKGKAFNIKELNTERIKFEVPKECYSSG